MNGHLTEEKLSDYVDGALPEAERDAATRHLSDCAECRTAHEGLQALLQETAALPAWIEPERDLWPEIEQRIRARAAGPTQASASARLRWWNGKPFRVWPGARMTGLAAAAVLIVAVGGALVLGRLGGDRPPFAGSANREAEANTAIIRAAAAQVEANYEAALGEYLTALSARRGTLAPETIDVIEENLRLIDSAIDEIRAAIEADPGSREQLVRLLATGYQTKLDVLRRAVRVPPMDDRETTS